MWKIMRYDRKTKTTRVEFEHSINFTSELLAALYCTQSTQHPCHECNSRMILFAKGKRRILDWQHGRRSFYMISFAVNPFYIYMVCLRWRAFLSARSSTRYFCLPTWHEDPLHDLLYGFGGVHDRIDIISSYHHRHHSPLRIDQGTSLRDAAYVINTLSISPLNICFFFFFAHRSLFTLTNQPWLTQLHSSMIAGRSKES